LPMNASPSPFCRLNRLLRRDESSGQVEWPLKKTGKRSLALRKRREVQFLRHKRREDSSLVEKKGKEPIEDQKAKNNNALRMRRGRGWAEKWSRFLLWRS